MAQFFEIHPDNPQPRLIRRAVEIVERGGVIAYPTDSSYALGCRIGDKAAMHRIRRIRTVDDKHRFTLVCSNMVSVGVFAKLDNTTHRLIKSLTPGAYTFILEATRELPRRLQQGKRRAVGIRIPDFPVVTALLEELKEPLMSSTLILPGDSLPLGDAEEIRERLEQDVDLVIDAGPGGIEPTTVVELTGDTPIVSRYGKGDASMFE